VTVDALVTIKLLLLKLSQN